MKKLLLVLTLLVFILACGGNNSSKGGKTFSLNAGEEPHSIDPQLSTDIVGGTVNDLISEGLTKKDKDGKVVGGLAEKWEVSQDGLVWTFHLKSGIKWSNGEPITANDFKSAWVRALDPKVASKYAYMLYPIKNAEAFNTDKAKAEDLGIKVIDDKTIEVTLEAPTPYFDDLVSFKTYMPVNEKFLKEVGEKYATEADKILSSGAYILKKWTHSSEMVLEKNPNYYDAGNVKVDRIILKLIQDNSSSLQAFKNDEVDVTVVTAEQAKEFKDDKRLHSANDGSVWYILFNNKIKGLDNIKIRKAFLMAIDREEMTKSVLNNTRTPAKTFVPAGIGMKGLKGDDFTKEVTSTIPQFNPEEAKKLLAEGLKEAGMDKLPTFEMIINDKGNNKVIAEYIQESLNKNLGVKIEVSTIEFQERVSRMKQKNYQLALAGWSGDFLDPITYLDLFITNGGNNDASYSNPKYDQLVKTIKSTGDQSVRMPAMIELEKLIAEELPVGVLYHRERQIVVNPRVKGFKLVAIGGEYYFGNLSVE